MKTVGEIIKEKNIRLDTNNSVLKGGFTQAPNFILRHTRLSAGAKVTYALFLSYAWHDDFCFRGQDRLAENMGMSRSRVTEFVGELQKTGLITIQRRGLNRTNLYTIHFQVAPQRPGADPSKIILQAATVGDIVKERNIQLDTDNPVLKGGFTQIPNFILRDPRLSPGAKVAYALFLSHAWHDDFCFPGQDRLAENMGISRPRVTQFVGELQKSGLITIHRRGLNLKNIYTIHFQVAPRRPSADLSTSGSWPADIRMSAGQHQDVDRMTTRGRPVNFPLYKNTQNKNIGNSL